MYKLEDFFEEAIIDRKKKEKWAGGVLLTPVCSPLTEFCFFGRNKEASDIMNKLDSLEKMTRLLQLKGDVNRNQYTSNRTYAREDTGPLISEDMIIGRDHDKDTIISKLLSSDHVQENVSVLILYGMGGIEKTASAQRVYNDKTVEQNFELTRWVCISDNISGFPGVMDKIYQSVVGDGSQNMEDRQRKLQQALDGKKFLIVLDDAWDENHDTWLRLKPLLSKGKRGSKILVTTRSAQVDLRMGAMETYELKALPEDMSWALFKSLAFKQGQEDTRSKLESIGREIIKKCGNVPLAIRTIAGILYTKDTYEEWRNFNEKEIRDVQGEGNNIMPTLKLSYGHLSPQEKQCFAFCSLFPKDDELCIERLYWLWMAQGFVKSRDQARACFMVLLRRCFFQDIKIDTYISHCQNGMVSCKMHDLMHDLVKEVNDECLLVDVHEVNQEKHIDDIIRHVHIPYVAYALRPRVRSWLHDLSEMSSLITFTSLVGVSDIFSCLRRIRALDLGHNHRYDLPNSVGKLKHLRYLKAWVDKLHKEITRLQYLQTLDLQGSHGIRELPSGFHKMTTLKQLRITRVAAPIFGLGSKKWVPMTNLVDMPKRFGELKALQVLDTFLVGENDGLDALSGLDLIGMLSITFSKYRPNAILEAKNANF